MVADWVLELSGRSECAAQTFVVPKNDNKERLVSDSTAHKKEDLTYTEDSKYYELLRQVYTLN